MLERLNKLIEDINTDYPKFMQKGNAAAGTRLRNNLLEVLKIAKEERKEIQKLRIVRGDPAVRFQKGYEEKLRKVLNNEPIQPQRNKEYMEAKARQRSREKERKALEKRREADINDTDDFIVV